MERLSIHSGYWSGTITDLPVIITVTSLGFYCKLEKVLKL